MSLVVPVLPSIHTLQQAAVCAAPPKNVPLISQSVKSRFTSNTRQVILLTLKQVSLQDLCVGPGSSSLRPPSFEIQSQPSRFFSSLGAASSLSVLRAEVCCIPCLSETCRQCRCSYSCCSWNTHAHTHTHKSLPLTGQSVLMPATSTQSTTDLPQPQPLLPRPSSIHDRQRMKSDHPPFSSEQIPQALLFHSPLLLDLVFLCFLSPALIAPCPCCVIALQGCCMLPDEVGCCST